MVSGDHQRAVLFFLHNPVGEVYLQQNIENRFIGGFV